MSEQLPPVPPPPGRPSPGDRPGLVTGAGVLLIVGGVIGIISGIATSKVLSIYANWPTLISISSIAIAFLFSAAVGVFFGFYPARKAAALDHIEALRYE